MKTTAVLRRARTPKRNCVYCGAAIQKGEQYVDFQQDLTDTRGFVYVSPRHKECWEANNQGRWDILRNWVYEGGRRSSP